MLYGMTTTPEPLDVVRWLKKCAQDLARWARKRLGLQLIGVLVNALVSVSLLFAVAPFAVAAGVAFALALALMAAYLIGLRRQYDDLETPTRWGLQIANRRLKRDVLKGELALRQATLLLAGDPRDRQEQFRMHAPGTQEFVRVLRWERGRRAVAAGAQRPQPRGPGSGSPRRSRRPTSLRCVAGATSSSVSSRSSTRRSRRWPCRRTASVPNS